MYTMKRMYPYNTRLILLYVSVLCNHTKTHTLLFLLNSSIHSPKQTDVCICIWLFSIFFANEFSEINFIIRLVCMNMII